MILWLVTAPLGGCSSTSNQPRDAAAAPHDAAKPHDATTHVDARDSAISDGAEPVPPIVCGDANCVLGQQYCYRLTNRHADAGATSNTCTAIPANCAHVDASSCGCVFEATQCRDADSTTCSLRAGIVLQASCQL